VVGFPPCCTSKASCFICQQLFFRRAAPCHAARAHAHTRTRARGRPSPAAATLPAAPPSPLRHPPRCATLPAAPPSPGPRPSASGVPGRVREVKSGHRNDGFSETMATLKKIEKYC
jgi:hypothetical protein